MVLKKVARVSRLTFKSRQVHKYDMGICLATKFPVVRSEHGVVERRVKREWDK